MKKLLFITCAIGSMVALAHSASAATFQCDSRENIVGQSAYGTVWLITTFGVFDICNVGQASGFVGPDTCRSWLTLLVSARGMNKNVEFHFETADQVNNDMVAPYCTTAANFSGQHRIPYLVRIRSDQP